MVSTHGFPASRPLGPEPRPAHHPADARQFGLLLLSVFLLGAGAVTAAILYESGVRGAAEIVAGPFLALAVGVPLWLLQRRRARA
jgi:hypothetical protein